MLAGCVCVWGVAIDHRKQLNNCVAVEQSASRACVAVVAATTAATTTTRMKAFRCLLLVVVVVVACHAAYDKKLFNVVSLITVSS